MSAAMFYASVSASFIVEQLGLPRLTQAKAEGEEIWNGDLPRRRLSILLDRHEADCDSLT